MTLNDFISRHTTVTAFAKKLGRSRAQVHRYLNGENVSKAVIEEISAATDGAVTPADWFTSADRPSARATHQGEAAA